MNKTTNIRIVQLIDSLEAGGAERMAVSYANALKRQTGFAALVTTRAEGQLKNQLDNDVVYGFLNRKSLFDFKALFLLRKIIINNKFEFFSYKNLISIPNLILLKEKKRGVLIVISSPSGAGKTTIAKKLVSKKLNIELSWFSSG